MFESGAQNGWTRVAFGDVVRLSRERSSDPERQGFQRYVGLDHLDPGELRLRRWGDVSEGTTFTNVFRAGQVLFGKRRAYQRKVALADFDGVCSSDIYVLEPKNADLLSELLPYICQTDGFFEHAVGTSAGSLSPRTNWESLASYEFALPPVEEQRRIATALRAESAAGHALQVAIARLKGVHQSILDRHFSHNPQVNAAWRALEEVTARVNDGTHQPPRFTASGVPFLLVSNIASGRIAWDVDKYVSLDTFEQLSRVWRPQKDDVLYSLVGSYGVPAIVDQQTPFTFQRHIGLIRTNPDELLPKFLYWYLMSPAGIQQAHVRAEGLAQKTITLGALRLFRVPAPSLELQRKLVAQIDAVQEGITSLEHRCGALSNFRKRLVAAGFGECR
jgi:type I restriction enzyme S subunit